MKKLIIIFTIISAAFMFFGCQETKKCVCVYEIISLKTGNVIDIVEENQDTFCWKSGSEGGSTFTEDVIYKKLISSKCGAVK